MSLLILGRGDTEYSDRNGRRLFDYALERGRDAQFADYDELDLLKDFEHDRIIVMPLFPYHFWNGNCENPDDTKLYGTSSLAHNLLTEFFLETQKTLEDLFGKERVHCVIPLDRAALDRDKNATLKRLVANEIPIPTQVTYSSAHDLVTQVSTGRGIFIKCRYGAEGKGITRIRANEWVTNYKVTAHRLCNHGNGEKWPFVEITGRFDLLQQLLEHEVVVEMEVLTQQGDNPKFDTRIYVVNGQTPHYFTRWNNAEIPTTNFSQGGIILHAPETTLEWHQVASAKIHAFRASEAVGLRFLGVDVMFDTTDGAKVVEVQTFTDFPDIDKFNLQEYLLDKSGLLD
jgi:hypothetical protein